MSRAALVLLVAVVACAGADHVEGPPAFTVEPDLRYGSADTGAASFSQLRALAVDGRGYLYALDTQEAAIRVFDPFGNVVRSIGRHGEGPGEFNAPTGLAFGPNGHLFVYDPRVRRVTVFDTAGSLLDTKVIPISSFAYTWGGGIDSAGRLIDRISVRTDSGRAEFVRRLDLVTLAADTLPFPSCGFDPHPVYAFPRGFMGVPYASGAKTWIDATGSVWCANTARAVALRTPFGSLAPVDSVVSAVVPARVSDAERASAVERVETFMSRSGNAPLDLGLIPDSKEVLLGLVRDDEGRVWMRVRDSVGVAMHVFAPPPGAEWQATVRMSEPPADFYRAVIRARKLYVIAEDSIGAPIVLRYPVELESSP
ncbi:MAG TPA: 6-bladed beta-propeller [Gemmatimonadaceae bacterium]|nr:6-bladed beta-propeller [Gemmatimonadaceae bacterium]